MNSKNPTTTPNGRTHLAFDANGALTGQNLDPSHYANRGFSGDIQRPKPAQPKTAAELNAELDRTQSELDAALNHFAKWLHKDPHAEEKRELRMILAQWEQKVIDSRARLAELEAEDSPHTKLLKAVAQVELNTSFLAHEAQLSAAQKAALDTYDQDYQKLTSETQREVYRRDSIAAIAHIASNAFHGFSRQDLAQRTLEGANIAVEKVRTALIKIGEVIAKSVK